MEKGVRTLEARDDTVHRNSRLFIAPEHYPGAESCREWRDHFENVAAVNGRDEEAKLLWLRVILIGRVQ